LSPAHEVVGEGQDAVLLVPGTFSDRRTWRQVVPAIAGGSRCILFDPRGTGDTPDPGLPFTPDDLADDLLAVLDAVGAERAHLVGHSLGAQVALLTAARHPARVGRVVAVAPMLQPDARVRAILNLWEALASSDVGDDVLHLGLVLPAFGRAAFETLVPALVRDLGRRPVARATILRYVACNRNQDLRPFTSRIDADVLVVAGAEDTMTGPEAAREVALAIPGARVELIGACGHTPQVERPDRLSELLLGFLSR
jgi:3-oxoadipate enol-lactonase